MSMKTLSVCADVVARYVPAATDGRDVVDVSSLLARSDHISIIMRSTKMIPSQFRSAVVTTIMTLSMCVVHESSALGQTMSPNDMFNATGVQQNRDVFSQQ